jgi:hypothetical protein
MNSVYNGLKYLTVWILLYFVIKCTCNDKLNNTDMILMASVLTLILCIIDNIFNMSSSQKDLFSTEYEYMTNLSENTTTTNTPDLFATGKTKNGFVIDESQPNDEKWHEQKLEPKNFSGTDNLDQIDTGNGQTRQNLLVNHMQYSDFNRMPPSFYQNDFEYGYSFMPPKDWYPVPPYPPVCSSNATCITQPVYTDNSTMNLKEWHQTQKITPADSINTRYLAEVVNSNN